MSRAAEGAEGTAFARIVERELQRLDDEIAAFGDEESLWRVTGTALNPAGTLALHIAGNLQHYVGAALGDTGYVRDRDAEFGERGVPREQLRARVAAAGRSVPAVLRELGTAELDAPYPGVAPGHMDEPTTRELLVHLTWHLGWHLGQIHYLRRLLAEGGP